MDLRAMMSYANDMFADDFRNKYDKSRRYTHTKKWTFDILNDIGEYVMLVRLTEKLFSVSKSGSITLVK